MARVNTLGSMASVGGFPAGPYRVNKAGYVIHQFTKKDGTAVGKAGTMFHMNLTALDENNEPKTNDKGEELTSDRYWPVGGNPEMWVPTNDPDSDPTEQADYGQYLGTGPKGNMNRLFADAEFVQFQNSLMNAGYDEDRWNQYDAFGLIGCILVLDEVPSTRNSKESTKTPAASDRTAAQVAGAKADVEKKRTVIVVTDIPEVPEECLAPEEEEKPKSKAKPGAKAPAKPAPAAGKAPAKAPVKSPAKKAAPVEVDHAAELQGAIGTVLEGKGNPASILLPMLKSNVLKAIDDLELGDEDKDALRELFNDADTRNSIMADMGYNASGATYKRA